MIPTTVGTSIMSFGKPPVDGESGDDRERDATGRSGLLAAFERHVARWQRLCVETRCQVFESDS
jgi:hypothetical protein